MTVSTPATACPFCARPEADVIAAGALAFAFLDVYPASPGHALIVPRRHEADFLALTSEEQAAVWALVPAVRAWIEERHRPDGYNIGVNVGAAAGQTVGHAHVHVIPRYAGDVEDPRGGVRWVLPGRAAYWSR